MPVRSLNSAVFSWPGRDDVLAEARNWAANIRAADPLVRRIFCVGSCARGDYGVGTDLDVIVIISDTNMSPIERLNRFDPRGISVPADVRIYTESEWQALKARAPGVWQHLSNEALELA